MAKFLMQDLSTRSKLLYLGIKGTDLSLKAVRSF